MKPMMTSQECSEDMSKVKCKKCDKKFNLKGGQKPPCDDTCCLLKYGMNGESYSFAEFVLPEPNLVFDFKTEEPKNYVYQNWPQGTNPQSQFYWPDEYSEHDPRHPFC
jgi:hypothetical protein